MTSVRGRFNCFILTTLLLIAIPIGDCGADCYYSCSDRQPARRRHSVQPRIRRELSPGRQRRTAGHGLRPSGLFQERLPDPGPAGAAPVYYESYRETRRERNRREFR